MACTDPRLGRCYFPSEVPSYRRSGHGDCADLVPWTEQLNSAIVTLEARARDQQLDLYTEDREVLIQYGGQSAWIATLARRIDDAEFIRARRREARCTHVVFEERETRRCYPLAEALRFGGT